MKRILLIPVFLALAVALFPLASHAGDDVTINDSVSLSVNSALLSVTSGAKINQIVVSNSSFTITMTGTSTIKVTSSGRRALTVSPSNMAASATCNANESSVTIGASSSGDPVTVTVDVSSNTCGGIGASGGGGGVTGVTTSGGSSSPAPSPTPSPTPAPVTVKPGAPVTTDQAQKIIAAAQAALASPPPPSNVVTGSSVSAMFTKNIGPGMTSSDVKRLQQLLNTDPDTQIAESGVGSPGHESDYYGALTVAAVQKFQKKYDLVSDGTPSTTGYGALGPKTRAAIEMYLSGETAPTGTESVMTPAPTPVVSPASVSTGSAPAVYLTSALAKGKTHSDVKSLQLVLNSDPETQISNSGVGSPGNETNYYGAMTEKAVQKFQEKYGIAAPGDTGYGSVGPKTRAKINELFGQQDSSANVSSPSPMHTPTPAAAETGSADAIQSQINAALKKVAELQSQIGTQATVTPAPPPPAPAPASSSTSDAAAIQKQIDDAMKKIQEISAQIKASS